VRPEAGAPGSGGERSLSPARGAAVLGGASSSGTDPLDAAFREEWGRVVATLIRRLGSWDLAEECAAEAFAEATRRWPREGLPDRPGAWLTTVATNRAVDRLRRARRGDELLEQVGRDPASETHVAGIDEMNELFDEGSAIEDDRLRLIFTCCHPALALEARVALTLRMLGGLSTPEIARAFLVEEATMAKRLTRAKAKIAGAGIPYRVPAADLLPARLEGVLAVVYLMFNEGYVASSGEALLRVDLCEEAVRLGRLLVSLMPDEAEAAGLLALMLFIHSRRLARVDDRGDLVTLEQQDRSLWDRALIGDGRALLSAALACGEAGPYVLQAAIGACHAEAKEAEATDWARIAGLYELLLDVMDTPVVRLNRAVAVAMSGDLAGGLEQLAALEAGGELNGYHLLAATRADLLRRAGRRTDAARWYRRAIADAPDGPEQRFLRAQLQRVSQEATRRDDGESP
jgi:RNA polymerase sigma-70 factor (ECF subfamily)